MKTYLMIPTLTVTLLAGALSPSALAAEPAPASVAEAAADGAFIQSATQANWSEIKLSALVRERTKRDDIKVFAASMSADHKDLDRQLTSLANQFKMELPKETTAEQQTTFALVKNAEDADVDRLYMDNAVTAHRKLVALYDATSKGTKNPSIKEFADRHLPHLQVHLQRAEELARTVGSIAVK